MFVALKCEECGQPQRLAVARNANMSARKRKQAGMETGSAPQNRDQNVTNCGGDYAHMYSAGVDVKALAETRRKAPDTWRFRGG